jgi:hypothetical protein
MEDEFLYSNSWWHEFQTVVPRDHGMPFASFNDSTRHGSIDLQTTGAQPVTSNTGTLCSNFSLRLEILKTALPPIHDAVLVCRGPLSSLCAQYYLESFSLQGLVMVDPILTNAERAPHHSDRHLEESMIAAGIVRGEEELKLFHSENLLLEPNAVPMLVLLSIPDISWNRAATNNVAERHGDQRGPYGLVPVVHVGISSSSEQQDGELACTDHGNGRGVATSAKEALATIEKWIDEIL